jgi:hypothetical protein
MTIEQLYSLTVHPIVQSDSTVIDPPLKAIVILAAGDLSFVDSEDSTVTKTFPDAASGGAYPFVLPCRIRQVKDTGTTLTDAQMIGLH